MILISKWLSVLNVKAWQSIYTYILNKSYKALVVTHYFLFCISADNGRYVHWNMRDTEQLYVTYVLHIVHSIRNAIVRLLTIVRPKRGLYSIPDRQRNHNGVFVILRRILSGTPKNLNQHNISSLVWLAYSDLSKIAPNDTSKCIFLIEHFWISTGFSLKSDLWCIKNYAL